MESNRQLDITMMVAHPELLEKAIINQNKFEGTDFEIIDTIFDEIPFCRITANNYSEKNLFALGYKLALLEQKFKQKNNRK